MKGSLLHIQQLEAKIRPFVPLQKIIVPSIGWIKSIRLALGISSEQLGSKLSITRQGVVNMESREKEGSVTIKTLREVAAALDMQLVYAFIPKDGSLDALIDKKAKELATQIVMRTSNTMKLEDQENSATRISKAIEERAAIIKREMPKSLWD